MHQYNLGQCYDQGLGVSMDKAQAMFWWQKAAIQGYDMAQYNLGVAMLTYNRGAHDIKVAKSWLLKAAEQGFAEAQYYQAKHYAEKGDGKKEVEWLTKAAKKGKVDAQYQLGLHYLKLASWRDFVLVFQWFEKASKQDHAPSQYNMGMCLGRGMGVSMDSKQGLQCIQTSAKNEYEPAQKWLDTYYHTPFH